MFQEDRPSPAGASYFFTASLHQENSQLLVDEIDGLLSAIAATAKTLPFYMDAWVVMPDHMHAVWTLPPGDDAHAQRWVQIKRRFTSALPLEKRNCGQVWQRGVAFQRLSGLVDYSDAIRRCWFDPVRHEMARLPEDWKFSSAHLEDEKIKLVA